MESGSGSWRRGKEGREGDSSEAVPFRARKAVTLIE
jgi:hypothetical protein